MSKNDNRSVSVPVLANYQPHNPYTEIQLLSHDKCIIRLLVKIDEQRCASSDDCCKVFLWNIKNGKCLHTLSAHNRPVTCMKIVSTTDSNGDMFIRLITAASDKKLFIWNVDSGECIAQVTENVGPIRCLLSLTTFNLVCTGGEKICLWDYNGNLKYSYDQTDCEDVQELLLMNESMLITAADMHLTGYTIKVTEENENSDANCIEFLKTKCQSHRECIKCFVKVNEYCFASGSLDGAIRIWQIPSFTCMKELNHVIDYIGMDKEYPYSVQHIVSLSERYIFAAIGTGFMVYDALLCKEVTSQKLAHYSKVLYLCFLYDGKFMATCSEDGAIRLWNFNNTVIKSINDFVPEDISKFFYNSVDMKNDNYNVQPMLIGDCLAHSGAVEMCIDYGTGGFISCGMDSLLISWKNGEIEQEAKDNLIRELIRNG